jgi:hypothetical protein
MGWPQTGFIEIESGDRLATVEDPSRGIVVPVRKFVCQQADDLPVPERPAHRP